MHLHLQLSLTFSLTRSLGISLCSKTFENYFGMMLYFRYYRLDFDILSLNIIGGCFVIKICYMHVYVYLMCRNVK